MYNRCTENQHARREETEREQSRRDKHWRAELLTNGTDVEEDRRELAVVQEWENIIEPAGVTIEEHHKHEATVVRHLFEQLITEEVPIEQRVQHVPNEEGY